MLQLYQEIKEFIYKLDDAKILAMIPDKDSKI